MKYQFLETANVERVSLITLNRVDKRNALNYNVIQELKVCFTAEINNPATKVIVLNAKGEVFSAGADLDYLQQLQKNSFEENLADSKHLKELFQLIYTSPKVVIACVQGHAIAGGCGLVSVCDFCFSVPEANFGFTEVKIGFIPALVMVYLVRRIGEGKARELLLSGHLYSAKEVQTMGLVNYIYSEESIAEEVLSFAKSLCRNVSSQSIKHTKEMLAHVGNMPLDEALDYAAKMNANMRSTDDCKKGIAAFLAKEKPTW